MSERNQIRVRTEKKHKMLYSDLKQLSLGEAHTVFFIATCIGYEAGKKQAFLSREDRFWGSTITNDEWAIYQSIFLSEEGNDNLQVITDDEQIIRRMEEYANGGINIILEELSLCFDKHDDGEVIVKKSEKENLLPRLLGFIYERVPQNTAMERNNESATD